MGNSDNFFLHKKILITGAGGFIGRHLLPQLQTYGAQISTFSRNHNNFPKEIEQFAIDIKDTYAVNECLQKCQPDHIFHLAAYKERDESIQAFYSSVETNVIGTLNLFSAAKDVTSVQSIVTLGTAEEYGNNTPPFNEKLRECPVTPYSFSKLCVSQMGELFFHLYNLPVIIVRPTLAYGPGQGTDMFLPSLITSLLENKPFDMTLGEQTRDFVYVADLVEALILASRNTNAHGQIINGKRGLVKLGGKPYRKNEVMDYYITTTKAERILGWKAKTSLKEGLNRTIAYYKGVKKG
jgi:nucleoside-diphosphate-sugar epimerase